LEQVRHIFGAGKVGATHHGDTGPGSSIALCLAELMGGRIGINAENGNDSMIWFEIPLDKQPAVDDSTQTLFDSRVLLITEEPAALNHFQSLIPMLHGAAIPASSKEAVDLLTRSIRLGNPIQALLVDVGTALTKDGTHRLGDLCD